VSGHLLVGGPIEFADTQDQLVKQLAAVAAGMVVGFNLRDDGLQRLPKILSGSRVSDGAGVGASDFVEVQGQ
jgi:hypothetical protein